MVERQPKRPTEPELKGALLRMLGNDYWKQSAPREISTTMALLAMFTNGASLKALEWQQDRFKEPWYDEAQKNRDLELIERERASEGIDPSESPLQFVERKLKELKHL